MILAVMAISMIPCTVFAEEETHVVILCTSDMHGNVCSWSYEDNAGTENNGMARLYTYIEQVREENPDTFLIDGGDDIQGTIMTDDLANKSPDDPHPVIAAMNYMGYDAMTLGNHEFNWGIPTLMKILGTAEFPVLAQNVLDKEGDLLTGSGWTIVERGGISLAVIGVVTPDIPIWDGGKEGIADYTYEAANTAVKKAISEIGDQADIIIVSAHMGMESQFDEEGQSDAALKILEDNPEVDVLQVAHMHVTVNEKKGNTVIGGVRNSGREIARIDLTLDGDRNIKDSEVTIVEMADYMPSEEILQIPVVKEMHEKTIALVNGVTPGGDGEVPEPLGVTTARFQPRMRLPVFRKESSGILR